MTTADWILLVALVVIFLAWSYGWYANRKNQGATRLYLSLLAGVLIMFVALFAPLHYLYHVA